MFTIHLALKSINIQNLIDKQKLTIHYARMREKERERKYRLVVSHTPIMIQF